MALELKDIQTQDAFTIDEGGVTLGREGGKAEVTLNDRGVSSLHCKLSFEQGKWLVEDLGSTNGTFVDGRKISGKTELQAGNTLALFRYKFEVLSLVTDGRPRGEVTQTALQTVAPPAASRSAPVATSAAIEEQPLEEPSGVVELDARAFDAEPAKEKEPLTVQRPRRAASAGSDNFITKVIACVWIFSFGLIALTLALRERPPQTLPPPQEEPQTAALAQPEPASAPLPLPLEEKPAPKKEAAPAGKTSFPRYMEKRKAIEDLVHADPTLLRAKPGVLPLFRKLNDDTARINKKRAKKGSKVDELLVQAEIYEATVRVVDELHVLLFD